MIYFDLTLPLHEGGVLPLPMPTMGDPVLEPPPQPK